MTSANLEFVDGVNEDLLVWRNNLCFFWTEGKKSLVISRKISQYNKMRSPFKNKNGSASPFNHGHRPREGNPPELTKVLPLSQLALNLGELFPTSDGLIEQIKRKWHWSFVLVLSCKLILIGLMTGEKVLFFFNNILVFWFFIRQILVMLYCYTWWPALLLWEIGYQGTSLVQLSCLNTISYKIYVI